MATKKKTVHTADSVHKELEEGLVLLRRVLEFYEKREAELHALVKDPNSTLPPEDYHAIWGFPEWNARQMGYSCFEYRVRYIDIEPIRSLRERMSGVITRERRRRAKLARKDSNTGDIVKLIDTCRPKDLEYTAIKRSQWDLYKHLLDLTKKREVPAVSSSPWGAQQRRRWRRYHDELTRNGKTRLKNPYENFWLRMRALLDSSYFESLRKDETQKHIYGYLARDRVESIDPTEGFLEFEKFINETRAARDITTTEDYESLIDRRTASKNDRIHEYPTFLVVERYKNMMLLSAGNEFFAVHKGLITDVSL